MKTDDLSFLRVKHHSEDLYKTFAKRAKILFEQFKITDKNDKQYTLVDIEFYLLALWHQDFFTYGYPEQKIFGEWLKHPSGMDLVFGDQDRRIYAGILIRGVRDVELGEYINGPLKVRDALSHTNHTVTCDELNNSVGLIKESKADDKLILVSSRVGLTPRSLYEHHKRLIMTHSEFDNILTSKHKDFINRKYRFITDICPDNKFKEKERVATISVNAGICSADLINEKYEWRVIKQ